VSARRHVPANDPALERRPQLAHAVATLHAFAPRDAQQAAFRRQFLEFCAAHPDALWRTCLDGHLTASGLIVDAGRERGLLCLHKKLGRWLQLGGHVDGEGNLALAALREAVEESGIGDLCIDPQPIDLDAHRIPARADEPEHWHLDVRYLLVARAGATPVLSSESVELRWFAKRELSSITTDDSVRRLYELAGLPG
jgi:8-oxo-dGTP pyrophosphatase MutT (NUDIX family)